jgi:hypothetical protein
MWRDTRGARQARAPKSLCHEADALTDRAEGRSDGIFADQ